jgi:hypothetical protein
MKVMHVQALKGEDSDFNGLSVNISQTEAAVDRPKIKESSSFRKEIRKQI